MISINRIVLIAWISFSYLIFSHLLAASRREEDQTTLQEKIGEYITPYLEMGSFSGVILVAQGEKILYNKGFGYADFDRRIPATPETKYLIGSLGKQFVAATILKLREEGKLSLDDPVSKYLSDYLHGAKMTIHQLLCHTSGLPMDVPPPTGDQAGASLKDQLNNLPLLFEPGTQYNYSNVGYQLLYLIIYIATGENPDDYMRRVIFQPLGMAGTGVVGSEPVEGLAPGYILEHLGPQDVSKYVLRQVGSAYGTAGDLHRWVRGLFEGKLIGSESLKLMLTPNLNNYGYAWFILDRDGRTQISHAGRMPGHSCNLLHLMETDITVIILSNIGNFPRTRVSNDLLSLVLDEPYVTPKARVAIEINKRLLGGYSGTYDMKDGSQIVVYSTTQFLFFTQTPAGFQGDPSNLPRFVLYPEAENMFFCKDIDCQLEFRELTRGVANSLRVTFNGEVFECRRSINR